MMANQFDDDSFEDSMIVPFFIGNRRVRIHIGGRRDALRRFTVAASELQYGSANESELIKAVSALAESLGLTIGDILDVGPPQVSSFDVAELVMLAARRPTAEQAWPRIKAVLTSASDDELDALMTPEKLSRVRPLLRAVLDDLDSGRSVAEDELRRELPLHYCYLLLG